MSEMSAEVLSRMLEDGRRYIMRSEPVFKRLCTALGGPVPPLSRAPNRSVFIAVSRSRGDNGDVASASQQCPPAVESEGGETIAAEFTTDGQAGREVLVSGPSQQRNAAPSPHTDASERPQVGTLM